MYTNTEQHGQVRKTNLILAKITHVGMNFAL